LTEPSPHAAAEEPTRAFSLPLVLLSLLLLAYVLYAPALGGPFLSDDIHYVQGNGYIHELSVDHLLAILDPTGPLIRVVENYAPVHLLLHGLAWQLFEDDVRGHHALNLLLHALASGLLFALFRRSGIPQLAALLGAVFFLVHPANVEAVAWINQLKTTSAMVLMLGALLAHPRRPALGMLLFALALLAKPPAALALFVVVVIGLAKRSDQQAPGEAANWKWRWVAGWGAVFVVFAVFEMLAFQQTAGTHAVAAPELDARLRTMLAVALRYGVMATSSHGLAVFQDLDPSSWLDPWWLASLPVLALLAWRAAACLRERRLEGAYWVWAAVAFAPVSGVIPLPHLVADRYLYFMLPGLIGATLLAAPVLLEACARRLGRPLPARTAVVLILVATLWIGFFAQRSWARAHVWQSERQLRADILRHFPEGRWALLERASAAAAQGRQDEAVDYLERARARGFSKLDVLLRPDYAALQGHPGYSAMLGELALAWTARIAAIAEPTQDDLMVLVQAQIVLGDLTGAQASVRRAIYAGGPRTAYLYQALSELERMQQAADAANE